MHTHTHTHTHTHRHTHTQQEYVREQSIPSWFFDTASLCTSSHPTLVALHLISCSSHPIRVAWHSSPVHLNPHSCGFVSHLLFISSPRLAWHLMACSSHPTRLAWLLSHPTRWAWHLISCDLIRLVGLGITYSARWRSCF